MPNPNSLPDISYHVSFFKLNLCIFAISIFLCVAHQKTAEPLVKRKKFSAQERRTLGTDIEKRNSLKKAHSYI
jgi:hypothetical protein